MRKGTLATATIWIPKRILTESAALKGASGSTAIWCINLPAAVTFLTVISHVTTA
jgi:ABC-type polysaccharide transport system permease subunit